MPDPTQPSDAHPWEVDCYHVAGVMPSRFGEGRCAWCARGGGLIWTGRRDINGKQMLAHVHRGEPDEFSHHRIVRWLGNGYVETLVNTTDEYGAMTPEVAALICNAVNGAERVRARCEVVEESYGGSWDSYSFMEINKERAATLRALNGDTDE